MSKRRTDRTTLVAWLLAIAALSVTAAVLWRWVSLPPERVTPSFPPASVSTPGNASAETGEDFSAAERRRLDDILRQKKSHGEQR